jgi:hypothetical protein
MNAIWKLYSEGCGVSVHRKGNTPIQWMLIFLRYEGLQPGVFQPGVIRCHSAPKNKHATTYFFVHGDKPQSVKKPHRGPNPHNPCLGTDADAAVIQHTSKAFPNNAFNLKASVFRSIRKKNAISFVYVGLVVYGRGRCDVSNVTRVESVWVFRVWVWVGPSLFEFAWIRICLNASGFVCVWICLSLNEFVSVCLRLFDIIQSITVPTKAALVCI